MQANISALLSLKRLLKLIIFIVFIQHHTVDGKSGSHTSYGWNYWPHELERSSAGYVGLVNLGATCYMASCVQQLFMIPKARAALLQVEASDKMKFPSILKELQRMFTYLQVRKVPHIIGRMLHSVPEGFLKKK